MLFRKEVKHMNQYLKMLVEEIHSTVVATVNDEGNPVTCVIDMMLADENGLYFLTAKGKMFYERLLSNPNISLTGFSGEETMSCKSVTVQGTVQDVGSDLLPNIFEKNTYMAEIYPSVESRTALTVFQIFRGKGEFFDLTLRPIFRDSFSFGGVELETHGYKVTDSCTGCGTCLEKCPQNCIITSTVPVVILDQNCLRCGKCVEICPSNAIHKV